jgi:hypothetical protein
MIQGKTSDMFNLKENIHEIIVNIKWSKYSNILNTKTLKY